MPEPRLYDDLVCFNFYRGWRLVQHIYARALNTDRLSPQRLYVLGLCRTATPSVGDLAAALNIDSQAISNLLRRMEADGLIVRRGDLAARRVVRVTATASGRQEFDRAGATIADIDRRLEADLAPGDLQTLRRIIDALDALARSAPSGDDSTAPAHPKAP